MKRDWLSESVSIGIWGISSLMLLPFWHVIKINASILTRNPILGPRRLPKMILFNLAHIEFLTQEIFHVVMANIPELVCLSWKYSECVEIIVVWCSPGAHSPQFIEPQELQKSLTNSFAFYADKISKKKKDIIGKYNPPSTWEFRQADNQNLN